MILMNETEAWRRQNKQWDQVTHGATQLYWPLLVLLKLSSLFTAPARLQEWLDDKLPRCTLLRLLYIRCNVVSATVQWHELGLLRSSDPGMLKFHSPPPPQRLCREASLNRTIFIEALSTGAERSMLITVGISPTSSNLFCKRQICVHVTKTNPAVFFNYFSDARYPVRWLHNEIYDSSGLILGSTVQLVWWDVTNALY
jgi:hypothetical protein